MDKNAIDTPSREIDLRNIPVHLRTALRRALEFEARAPAPTSAEEAEQCEEQLRAIADEFFGALLTPVLQRAVRSAAVGDAASALVRHLGGCGATAWRPSTFAPPGATVPVTTPYYREKHARRAKRRPGLYPALVVLGAGARRSWPPASRAVAMLSSLAEAQAQLRSDGIALDIKPSARPPIATLRGPERSRARRAGPREGSGCVSLDGGRPCEAQEAWPQDEAQPIPYRLEGTEARTSSATRATVSDVGPDHRRHAPGTGGGLRLLLSYARDRTRTRCADGAHWRRLQRHTGWG